MTQGQDAYRENAATVKKHYGPSKRPAGAAGADLAPKEEKPKEETSEERAKREHDEVLMANPGAEREAVLKRQQEEARKRREQQDQGK